MVPFHFSVLQLGPHLTRLSFIQSPHPSFPHPPHPHPPHPPSPIPSNLWTRVPPPDHTPSFFLTTIPGMSTRYLRWSCSNGDKRPPCFPRPQLLILPFTSASRKWFNVFTENGFLSVAVLFPFFVFMLCSIVVVVFVSLCCFMKQGFFGVFFTSLDRFVPAFSKVDFCTFLLLCRQPHRLVTLYCF